MSRIVSRSRQRILSLWLRRLSTDRLRRRWHEDGKAADGQVSGQAAGTPLVVVGKCGNAERLVAIDDAAEALGLSVGLTLAQARAMHPAVVAVPQDAAADAKLLAALADWCLRYTPLVATDAPDALLLDIGGCAHLFGGEEALRSDLVARLTQQGFAVRAAIADTIGAAIAAARFSATGIVAPGEERALLEPLPLAALRLADETVAALERVGLKRIADILDLPRSPLAARFGADLLRQLDRALGDEREPLNPRLPVPPYFTEQRFAEPITHEKEVLTVAQKLAARLAILLEQRGEGARSVELRLFRTDGAVRCIVAGTSRPLRAPPAIRALFAERLAALADAWDPGFGFDLVRLAVLVAEPAPSEQMGLNARAEPDALDHLVDRLAARLGRHGVSRLVAYDSHIPELACASVPAQTALARNESGWDAFRRFRAAANLPERPLRLLPRPEPIEAVAAVPDGPPLRFRWRRALHEVAAAEGPERIEGLWWSDEKGPARDYFRVEDVSGRRFWLFRAGLYRDGDAPSWFLHGMFA